jgi:uncharacterized caspase-like protein
MVAFVAGIGNYNKQRRLKNPVPDATAMKLLLEALGVEVFVVYDCDIKQLREVFDLFEASLRPGDAAFLSFAGHGTMFKNSVRLMAIVNSVKTDIDKHALNLDVLIAR